MELDQIDEDSDHSKEQENEPVKTLFLCIIDNLSIKKTLQNKFFNS